jgi:ABC-type polysaccharide/polyol phosphate transport system ATPase subunit
VVTAPFQLQDISFAMTSGERAALLGQNGAGKTTLLRLLGGVFRAHGGTIWARGRVSAVIGWAPLFSPELTPREHVRAYGVVVGAELDVAEVIGFAGLEAVAGRPVRLLSAGEQARLALAPGLSAPADVYLIDEGLSLCDPAFRATAIEHLQRRAAQGAAVILAGQDLLTARALCRRGLLLECGRLVVDTDLDAAIAAFTAPVHGDEGPAAAVIEGVEVQGAAGTDGERIGLSCRVRTDPGTFLFLVAVKRPNGAIVHSSRSAFSQPADGARRAVRTLATGIPASSLPPGTYQIAVAVTDATGVPLATREDAAVLDRSAPTSLPQLPLARLREVATERKATREPG